MRKKTKLKIINSLKISSPCHNDNFITNSTETKSGWYCGECKKDVHDLSKYSQKDILKLIEETNGHFCAKITRSTDGSIITKEPKSYSRALLASGAILASTTLLQEEVFAQVKTTNNTNQQVVVPNQATLGEIAVPLTPAPSPVITNEKDPPKTQATENCQESTVPKAVERGGISLPQPPEPTVGKIIMPPKTKK